VRRALTFHPTNTTALDEQEKSMSQATWPEAANRRLRALLWKGWSASEMSQALDRPVADVLSQMRRLGLARRSAG
jgi:hypothetical protein